MIRPRAICHICMCMWRERGGARARGGQESMNNLLLLLSTGLNLNKALSPKPCYWGPDFSVNNEWYYLKITYTWVVSKPRWSADKALVCYREEWRQLCPCPCRAREPVWKHRCYFTREVCELLQGKIAFFLARQWRLKTLNPALLEWISLAVTEKSITDRAKTA